MNSHDPHQALKHDIIREARSGVMHARLVRLQWSKTDIGYSLHVSPNSYSLSGFQATDLLSLIGLSRSACAFFDGRQCYVRWVSEHFDVEQFLRQFEQAYVAISESHRHFEACGVFLDQPEGSGFFMGRESARRRLEFSMHGDGHSALKTESMKRAEDAVFDYRFSWIETRSEKGWVIHYRPKHLPVSTEMGGVLAMVRAAPFRECPEYDFEPCFYRTIAFQNRGDSVFDSNAETAHRWFGAHATQFAPGLEKLLRANALMEEVGLPILPLRARDERLSADIAQRVARPKAKRAAPETPEVFDVAISFAGTERLHAEQLASVIKDAGYSVFFDDFYPEYLWGKNLVDVFDEIYRKRARFCVIFVSAAYRDREWTNHERKSAQARALKERGSEYILPIKVDETELPGMAPTLGYVPLAMGVDKIAALLVRKLADAPRR